MYTVYHLSTKVGAVRILFLPFAIERSPHSIHHAAASLGARAHVRARATCAEA